MEEKIINENVKIVEKRPIVKKNFYAVGYDKKEGKSYIKPMNHVNIIQARKKGRAWAKRNKLVFEGVHAN